MRPFGSLRAACFDGPEVGWCDEVDGLEVGWCDAVGEAEVGWCDAVDEDVVRLP